MQLKENKILISIVIVFVVYFLKKIINTPHLILLICLGVFFIYKTVTLKKTKILWNSALIIMKKLKKELLYVLISSLVMTTWRFAGDPSDWLFYLVCTLLILLLLIFILLKVSTVTISLLLIFLIILMLTGLFNSGWWTGIALCSNLFLLLWSEDIIPLISDEVVENYEVSFKLKRRILQLKVNILMGNICIYFSLIISEVVFKINFVDTAIKNVQENKDHILNVINDNLFPIITLGVVRIFIFMILFVIVLVIFKLIRKKSKLINDIKQDMKNSTS